VNMNASWVPSLIRISVLTPARVQLNQTEEKNACKIVRAVSDQPKYRDRPGRRTSQDQHLFASQAVITEKAQPIFRRVYFATEH